MSVPVRRHPDVAYDIVEIVDYIALDSGDAASRFAPAVEAAIKGLAEMPGKGSLKEFDHPRLAGVRSWSVAGFPNHLILYRHEPDGGVYVIAVAHGARQLPGFLLRRA